MCQFNCWTPLSKMLTFVKWHCRMLHTYLHNFIHITIGHCYDIRSEKPNQCSSGPRLCAWLYWHLFNYVTFALRCFYILFWYYKYTQFYSHWNCTLPWYQLQSTKSMLVFVKSSVLASIDMITLTCNQQDSC